MIGSGPHTTQMKLMIQIKEKVGEKHCQLVFTVFVPSVHDSKVQKKGGFYMMATYTVFKL